MDPTLIKDIINSYIPPNPGISSDESIMSIAGIEHLENIWSNIYAHFLDDTGAHGLGPAFIRCLEWLIHKKSGRVVSLRGAVVKREVPTIKGNRIDLLIQAPEHSVIIENKVHHHLNNDLEDYWLSVYGNDESKTGIVLTLSHILTNNPHYINITHLEWITEVEKEIILKHIIVNSATSTLFYDFIQNIKQISGTMNEYDVNFYLENRVAINDLNSVVTNYRRWLHSIFNNRDFIKSLGDFTLVHNDWVGAKERFAMYRFAATDELVITIFYEQLWKSAPGEARLRLFLQPLGNWFDKAINNESAIRSIASKCGVPSMDRHKDFWHCASVEIPVDEEQLKSEEALKKHISRYIADSDSGLMSAARQISDLLSQAHTPTYQWRDALIMLQRLLPKEDEENSRFWCSPIEFKSYDSINHIVILEVIDNLFRAEIERNYSDALLRAIGYAYGKDAKFSICCQQYMF